MRRLQEFEPIPGRYEREPDENREEGWTDWEQPVQRPCGVLKKKKVLLRYNVRTIQFTTLYNLVVFRVFRVVQLSP